MEDDIDIYADLPSINLDPDKNDQLCNCKTLKEEISTLENKLEKIQKIKENLEQNLSALLKTAKAEIARKDKTISELRKRLDDVTFRRNNRGDFSHRSSYKLQTTVGKYGNTSLMQSQEDETELDETESHEIHRNEHKSTKPHDGQLPTVFAERLHKRIVKDEKDDTVQETSMKLDIKAGSKGISEENIMESDKENGSQSNNNNDSESNAITQHSDSENSCRKDSEKRKNEEDNTHRNKRLKIDNSEGKSTTNEIDYDYTVQYELKDKLAQYAKSEDRLNATHSLKEDEILFDKCGASRATLEHQDTAKRSRDCTNDWKKEERNNSRIASNYIPEESNNYCKRNGHRYTPPRKSYSRSRSDYESSSSHRLREKSDRIYRNNRKYDDYKYDNQYRSKRDYRLKKDYESIENGNKTRHRSRECDDVTREKSKHSSKDVEDKDGNSLHKSKKYESRRKKETIASNSHNKGLHEREKAATRVDSRGFPSCQIVNNSINHSIKEITKQDKTKNESNIKIINSTQNTSTYVEENSNLEEGEIVDSPEKKIDSAKMSTNYNVARNNIENVLLKDKKKDKNQDVPVTETVDKSIPLQNESITAKQLDNVTINTKEDVNMNTEQVEAASRLAQTTLRDPGKITELSSSSKNNAVINEDQRYNNYEDISKSQSKDLTASTTCTIETIEQICEPECKDLTDSTTCTTGTINQVCESNADDENRVEEELKISITETAIKIKEMADSNIENAIEIKRINTRNVEIAINKDKVSESNPEDLVIIAETNNRDNNKINDEELKIPTAEVARKVESVPNCNIKNEDANQISIENQTSRGTSDKSNVEKNHSCLNDHNYVQDPPVNNLGIVRESPVNPGSCETTLQAATLKEAKVEENVDVSLTNTVKKTISSTVKNKKNQQIKRIVISRRLKAVTLSDSNASMTVLMNTKPPSNISNNSSNESVSKPRACKASRACK